nr:ATP-binding protein [Wenzhouxiangella sp. XN79A]
MRSQLIVYVLVPVAVLSLAMFWLTSRSVESLLEARMEKEIELVARSLRMPLEGALRSADIGQLRDALGAVSEIGRVYGAAVYDSDGRRIAVAGEAIPGPAEQAQAAELVAVGEQLGQYEDFAGEAVYSYFVPLSTVYGRIDGLLQVVREESDIRDRLDRTRWMGMLGMLFGLGLILVVLLIGHQWALMRPIRRLLDDMRQVEQGDRSWRAGAGTTREFGRLARGLNHMLDALCHAEDEVRRRRDVEAALNQRILQQESQAALGRFSAGVAHELGAPLTVIETDARRLQGHVGDDEGRRRLLRIGEQLQRTRQLVEQLISLVRDQPGRFERLDLIDSVDRAVAGARPEAQTRGIELEQEGNRPVAVEGVSVRIEHAVLNLVRNAIQAARSRVRVEVGVVQRCARISVEDDGPGLDPDLRDAAFESFTTGRPSGEGVGLGLTIVRTVTEIHGGTTRLGRSEALGGCRAEIHLPLAERA